MVEDCIDYGLDILFCGYNPGIHAGKTGNHFSGTNEFWRIICESEIVPAHVTIKDELDLPSKYSIGITNLVERTTKSSSDLKQFEMKEASKVLKIKVKKFKSRIICFVGKGVYEAYVGKKCKEWGLQLDKTDETLHFVVPSTSRRVVNYQYKDKLKFFKSLKKLI